MAHHLLKSLELASTDVDFVVNWKGTMFVRNCHCRRSKIHVLNPIYQNFQMVSLFFYHLKRRFNKVTIKYPVIVTIVPWPPNVLYIPHRMWFCHLSVRAHYTYNIMDKWGVAYVTILDARLYVCDAINLCRILELGAHLVIWTVMCAAFRPRHLYVGHALVNMHDYFNDSIC